MRAGGIGGRTDGEGGLSEGEGVPAARGAKGSGGGCEACAGGGCEACGGSDARPGGVGAAMPINVRERSGRWRTSAGGELAGCMPAGGSSTTGAGGAADGVALPMSGAMPISVCERIGR